MPLWSSGGALTPLDTTRAGYTLTGTVPTRWTRKWQSVQRVQFKSTPNTIHQWEVAGVPKVSNMEEVRHLQPQHVPCSKSAGLSYPNHGTRRD